MHCCIFSRRQDNFFITKWTLTTGYFRTTCTCIFLHKTATPQSPQRLAGKTVRPWIPFSSCTISSGSRPELRGATRSDPGRDPNFTMHNQRHLNSQLEQSLAPGLPGNIVVVIALKKSWRHRRTRLIEKLTDIRARIHAEKFAVTRRKQLRWKRPTCILSARARWTCRHCWLRPVPKTTRSRGSLSPEWTASYLQCAQVSCSTIQARTHSARTPHKSFKAQLASVKSPRSTMFLGAVTGLVLRAAWCNCFESAAPNHLPACPQDDNVWWPEKIALPSKQMDPPESRCFLSGPYSSSTLAQKSENGKLVCHALISWANRLNSSVFSFVCNCRKMGLNSWNTFLVGHKSSKPKSMRFQHKYQLQTPPPFQTSAARPSDLLHVVLQQLGGGQTQLALAVRAAAAPPAARPSRVRAFLVDVRLRPRDTGTATHMLAKKSHWTYSSACKKYHRLVPFGVPTTANNWPHSHR